MSMRVAVISDVHGNLPALEAVLAEVEQAGVDLVVVGGDVANGPMPVPTIERLAALGDRARFVRGNGDRELVAAFDGSAPGPDRPEAARLSSDWCAKQIDRAHRDFLAAFADRVAVDVDGLGPTLCCHASPRNDVDVFTARSPAQWIRAFFTGVAERVVTCGHTHMQFELDVDGIHIVNVGSVGMPYEGRSGAFWALLGPGVALRHTAYDAELAAERVRATGYPLARDFAERNVLRPPTRDEAFAYMDRLAGGR